MHLILFWLVVLSMSGFATASDSPFVGQWKLNHQKSTVAGSVTTFMNLGHNKFEIAGSGQTDVVVADGTDQPAPYGETTSMRQMDPNTWKIVGKKDGRVVDEQIWKISEDQKAADTHATVFHADGSMTVSDYHSVRFSGQKGLAGGWKLEKATFGPSKGIVIESYDKTGTSFRFPTRQAKLAVRFDGKGYALEGPDETNQILVYGREISASAFELTEKDVSGKFLNKEEWRLSEDGKMLTVSRYNAGENRPTIRVYERPF